MYNMRARSISRRSRKATRIALKLLDFILENVYETTGEKNIYHINYL